MGDDDHRHALLGRQPAERADDLLRCGAVEVAGRFVGEDDARFVGERPGDGNPLLLTAGQARRKVRRTVRQADAGEELRNT